VKKTKGIKGTKLELNAAFDEHLKMVGQPNAACVIKITI
jgi:hypothetical protein